MAYRVESSDLQIIRLERWQVVLLHGVRIEGVPMPVMPEHVRCDGGCGEKLMTSPLLDCMGDVLDVRKLGMDSVSQVEELFDPEMVVHTQKGSTYVLGARGR